MFPNLVMMHSQVWVLEALPLVKVITKLVLRKCMFI